MTESPAFSQAFVDDLHTLATIVFGAVDRSGLEWKLSRMPDPTVQVARAGSVLAGFKIGYALSNTRYYSWLGGVHPDHRRRGLALQLTERQHRHAREVGFESVETGLVPENSAMLSVNLRAGLHVHGMYTRGSGPRLMMLREF